VTITTGAALAPDDEPPGTEAAGISVEADTSRETGASFVFVPHVIGGISLTVAPDVINEGLPAEATVDDAVHPTVHPADSRPVLSTVDRPPAEPPNDHPGRAVGNSVRPVTGQTTTEEPPTSPPLTRADRVRAGLPFTGPGLTGLGGVVLGCLVVGLGAAGDLALGGGLGVGFTATFLLGCLLVAAMLRTRALAVAVVLPPLLFSGGYALETKTSGQTSGRREMALDVATSLAMHAPMLFLGTALAVAVVLVRVVVHLFRR
jgi:hypothetical protein